MQVNTNRNSIVPISEANQNFSKVARLVDESDAAIILKNNVPRYVILEYSQLQKEEIIGGEEIIVDCSGFAGYAERLTCSLLIR